MSFQKGKFYVLCDVESFNQDPNNEEISKFLGDDVFEVLELSNAFKNVSTIKIRGEVYKAKNLFFEYKVFTINREFKYFREVQMPKDIEKCFIFRDNNDQSGLANFEYCNSISEAQDKISCKINPEEWAICKIIQQTKQEVKISFKNVS